MPFSPPRFMKMKGLTVHWHSGSNLMKDLTYQDWRLNGKIQTNTKQNIIITLVITIWNFILEYISKKYFPVCFQRLLPASPFRTWLLSPPAVRSRLLRLRSLWDEIRQRAEEREGKLNDVLDLAGKFWADVAALLSTLRDSQDIVKELEDPGVDPSLIKQQIEAAEVWRTWGMGKG